MVECFLTFEPLAAKVKSALTDKKKSINIFKQGGKKELDELLLVSRGIYSTLALT